MHRISVTLLTLVLCTSCQPEAQDYADLAQDAELLDALTDPSSLAPDAGPAVTDGGLGRSDGGLDSSDDGLDRADAGPGPDGDGRDPADASPEPDGGGRDSADAGPEPDGGGRDSADAGPEPDGGGRDPADAGPAPDEGGRDPADAHPEPARQCANGRDDDGDGVVDLADPGCVDGRDGDEADPELSPVCADGVDNDWDGATDFPDDPGCPAAGAASEGLPCDAPVPFVVLGDDGGEVVLQAGAHRVWDLPCSDHRWGQVVVAVQLTERSNVRVRARGAGLGARARCADPHAALACVNHDLELRGLDVGTTFIIVQPPSEEAEVRVRVEVTPPPAACGDEWDNDGDGLVDAADPGCESSMDPDEADPDEPAECADGVDNDGDGATDYPEDNTCTYAGANSERPRDPISCGAVPECERAPHCCAVPWWLPGGTGGVGHLPGYALFGVPDPSPWHEGCLYVERDGCDRLRGRGTQGGAICNEDSNRWYESWDYDGRGNLVSERSSEHVFMEQVIDEVYTYTYDDAGYRTLTEVLVANDDGPCLHGWVRYVNDPLGRVVREETRVGDCDRVSPSLDEPPLRISTFEYVGCQPTEFVDLDADGSVDETLHHIQLLPPPGAGERCDPAAPRGCVEGTLCACEEGTYCDAERAPPVCVEHHCGDGILGPEEACDDANRVDNDGCTGRCRFGAPGEGFPCRPTGLPCEPGSYCAPQPDGFRCVAHLALGAACDRSGDGARCRPEHWCLPTEVAGTGACGPLPGAPVGEPLDEMEPNETREEVDRHPYQPGTAVSAWIGDGMGWCRAPCDLEPNPWGEWDQCGDGLVCDPGTLSCVPAIDRPCADFSDEHTYDVFALALLEPARVRVATYADQDRSCPQGIDTRLYRVDPDLLLGDRDILNVIDPDARFAYDDNGGVGACSLLTEWLDAGTHYYLVTEAGQDDMLSYVIDWRALPEVAAGERCDVEGIVDSCSMGLSCVAEAGTNDGRCE